MQEVSENGWKAADILRQSKRSFRTSEMMELECSQGIPEMVLEAETI